MRILLCSHDAVDDKVGATVEHQAKVLEGCQGEHPAADYKDYDEEEEEEEEDDDKEEEKFDGCQGDKHPAGECDMKVLKVLKAKEEQEYEDYGEEDDD